MIHLDAHPDMSASSSLPADLIFDDPREVHAAMRKDPGGIAQWILPAVYGGHLRTIWWVSPEWCTQIEDGEYDVSVGKASRRPEFSAATMGLDARAPMVDAAGNRVLGGQSSVVALSPNADFATLETVHISCDQPYFVEDGIYAPKSQLACSKPLRLVVAEMPGVDDAATTLEKLQVPELGDTAASSRPWLLDVCLDYFVCGNPFVSQVRPEVVAPFADAQNMAAFRQGAVGDDIAAFLARRSAFDTDYQALLKAACEAAEAGGLETTMLEALLKSLGCHLEDEEGPNIIDSLREALAAARPSELEAILAAGDMVTLPLQRESTLPEIEEKLEAFETFITAAMRTGGKAAGLAARPCAVTLARSVVDGFCPMRWCVHLEKRLLDILERLMGPLEVFYSDELELLENGLR
eukprot:TRINITY_DN34277_c0_g1_i1.p1 TRINITY_DN34277_c0_g1~~TRINITY_DN34277_c0_g1_i1.p1  ORF type:complete len:409 (+),score=74.28 TRINITY_DN34277_c0_g1_i1:149-1375(+)